VDALFTGGLAAEIYDAARDAWSSAGTLPELRTDHTAFLLGDGRIYVTTARRSFLVTPDGSLWVSRC